MLFKRKEKYTLDMNRIPAHIAFIMDGNCRCSNNIKMPRSYGHHEATNTLRYLALEANILGVKAMTVYAFSTENFKREQSEVEYIFKLPKEFFSLYFQELMDNNVRIMTIGHLELAPQETQDIINDAINKTKDNTGLKLVFAFIYAGCDELVEGKIALDNITEDYFESHLMTKELPPVDLMIRSSGECRLSNFLLWQLSYAEFIFDDAYWPDFNAEKLHECIWKYQNRDRRYGGVKK